MINLLNEKEAQYKEKIENINNDNSELLNKLKTAEENYLKLVEENHENENSLNLITKLNNILNETQEDINELDDTSINNIKGTIDNLKRLISNTNIYITDAIQTDDLFDPKYIEKVFKIFYIILINILFFK